MRLVRGSISFLPSLGSRGVRAPNYRDKGAVVTGIPQTAGSGLAHTPAFWTYQLDDLDKDPVVGGGRHELEEQWGQGQVVLGVAAG